MATITDTARDQATLAELKQRANAIADALTEAHALVEMAKDEAGLLARDLVQSHERERFARCDYEVTILAEAIATDVGATDEHGDFDLDRTPQEARDLVALMEFASSRDARATSGRDEGSQSAS